MQLASVCEEAALAAGFAAEERPYHPHLTLSRIRPWQDVSDLVDRVSAFPLDRSRHIDAERIPTKTARLTCSTPRTCGAIGQLRPTAYGISTSGATPG